MAAITPGDRVAAYAIVGSLLAAVALVASLASYHLITGVVRRLRAEEDPS